MKKTIILILTACLSFAVMSQKIGDKNSREYKTLFGNGNIKHGGYGGLSINYSQLDGSDALLVGARGAWIINHVIGIGVGGYGITNDIKRDLSGSNNQYQLAGGYGGLLIEPIVGANWPVHLAFPVLVGAGGIAYVHNYWNNSSPNYDNSFYSLANDAFFVLEPGVEIELNVVKFFRIAFGAYYRYTSNVTLSYNSLDNGELITDKPDLKAFSFGTTLKFGKF